MLDIHVVGLLKIHARNKNFVGEIAHEKLE
jgi:hypothetical protein